MNIYVLLKEIKESEEAFTLLNNELNVSSVQYVINPYDEYAIEEALRLKDKHDATITLVTLGNETRDFVYKALAMGADEAVEIKMNASIEDWDAYTTAMILSCFFEKHHADLILCGQVSIDEASGQVGPRLANTLGIPCITSSKQIEVIDEKVHIHKAIEGNVEVVEVNLPVIATCLQSVHTPRFPTLPGIMKAKKKPFHTFTLENLEIDPTTVQSKTKIVEYILPEKKSDIEWLEGTQAQQIETLLQILKNKEKVL